MVLLKKNSEKTYTLLREMKISEEEAEGLAKKCHEFLCWLDPASNSARSAIKEACKNKLTGEKALNYIKKQIKKGLDIYFIYSDTQTQRTPPKPYFQNS